MARKSEIRALAREGLDALLKAANTSNDQEAEGLLSTALQRLSEAAGVTPKGTTLREAAGKGGKKRSKGEPGPDRSLREVLAFASGQSTDNPRAQGGLLERVTGDPHAREYLQS